MTNTLLTATAVPAQNLPGHRARFLSAFVFLVGFLFWTPPASAQTSTGEVAGRVTNALTGRVINNARVAVPSLGRTVFTNEYGDFRVSGLPAGDVTLEVFFTGLDPQTVAVTVAPGQAATANVLLTSVARTTDGDGETILMSEFVVQATEEDGAAIAVNEQRFAPNLKTVIAADAFGDVTEGNPGEFLKYLPGVSVDYVAADVRTVSVRGFGSAFTSVNVDGNRMASAASSGASRTFEFEQVSMNNVARIEVVKVPTPSMPADSLGGSVNLVSKNAFERDQREIKYRAYLSLSDENLTLSKRPGPNVEKKRPARLGFDFSYAEPFSSTFGVVLNGLLSDQFNEQHRSQTSFQNSGGTVASPTNPYLRTYTVQDGPKETLRQSIGVNADWKLTANGVLGFGYQFNDYDSFFGNRNRNVNAGTNATDFGADFTNGRARAGEVTGGGSFRNKFGSTHHAKLDFKHFGRDLKWDTGVYYSYASNKYRDIDNGYFSGVGTRVRNVTVAFDGIDPFRPRNIAVADTNGAPLDWTRLAPFSLRNTRSQQWDSWDEFTGAHVNLERTFGGLAVPVTIKGGLNVRSQERDIIRRQDDWDYLGPDGRAESADDSALPFLDTVYLNQDPHFGLSGIEWIDPNKVYQHFVANPSYFRPNVNNWQNRVQNDYNLTETITAAYLQGNTSFFDDRLAVLGGLRFEKTDIDGVGFLFLPDAIFNANGSLITTDVYQQRRLQYQRRAATATASYDDVYPSMHFTYNIGENLILRAAYAKTLGRPDFSNVLPGTVIDPDENPIAGEPGGRITVRNTALRPYEGDNYDLSLEYYFKPAGVLSIGVFQKDIKDFFSSIVTLVDADDLATFDLDPQYLGYRLQTRTNGGEARVRGWEFNYMQQLVFLPGPLANFSVFANGTFLDLEGGVTADFSGFIEETGNFGFSYSGKKFDAKVKWNYRGEQFRSFQTFAPGAVEIFADRLYLDLNFEYRFSRRIVLFANARNVLNEPQELLRFGPNTPEYARSYQTEEFAVQLAFGVKGTF